MATTVDNSVNNTRLSKFIFKTKKVRLAFLDEKYEPENTELVGDILSVIHVYSCENTGKIDISKQEEENHVLFHPRILDPCTSKCVVC